jgi:hypothetical protein
VNKETRNGPKNIMTESNVPFRIRGALLAVAKIDNDSKSLKAARSARNLSLAEWSPGKIEATERDSHA